MDTPIDKRIFLAAIPCLTSGWFAARQVRADIPPGLAWRFFTGAEVGRTAREQLGPGLLLPGGASGGAVAATTRALAACASELLFEATFAAGAFVARADALRRQGDGWELIEVKSSTHDPAKKPDQDLIDDLAYTAFVARAAGATLGRLTLMLISPDYRLGAECSLLVEVDVTAAALARAEEFAALATAIAGAVLATVQPPPELKLVCRSCEFFRSNCLGVDVPDSILLLPRLSQKRFEPIRRFARISALPADVELTPPQARVAQVIRSGIPDRIAAGLTRLEEITWPAHYLDFESVSPGLPWFDGTAPYEAMPFQYSLHVRQAPGDEARHVEYLAPLGADWRVALATQLLEQLGQRGSVITYSGYEKRMLRHLALAAPALAPAIDKVIDRLFDLELVVREGYCHPAFAGHTSIKYVLPALAPELRYDALEIGGGDDAAGAFGLMWVGEWEPERHAAVRQQLQEYCKLDTLAMVRVHDELVRVWQELSAGR